MIPISRFREWCIELMAEVNAGEVRIEHLVMGVDEGHIVKKIKDKKGGVPVCELSGCNR